MAIRFCIPDLTTGDNDGTSETHAWQTIAQCISNYAAGDHVYFKTAADGSRANSEDVGQDGGSGRSQFATASTDSSGPTIFEGYKDTPGDRGMFMMGGCARIQGDNITVLYWDVDSGNSNNGAFQLDGDGTLLYRCVASNSYGTGSSSSPPTIKMADATILECAVYGSGDATTEGVVAANGNAKIINCYIELRESLSGSMVNGCAIVMNVARRFMDVQGCVISDRSNNTNSAGIRIANNVHPRGHTVMNNTFLGWNIAIHDEDGVDVSNYTDGPRLYLNNVFYNCGEGYRMSGAVAAGPAGFFIGNSYGQITTSQRTAPGMTIDEITLTETPFTIFAAGETVGDPSIQTSPFTYLQDKLSLNNTPGGGALVKGIIPGGVSYAAGLSGAFTGGTGSQVSFRSGGAIVPNPFPESSNVF